MKVSYQEITKSEFIHMKLSFLSLLSRLVKIDPGYQRRHDTLLSFLMYLYSTASSHALSICTDSRFKTVNKKKR